MLQAAYRAGKAEPPARLEIEAVQRFATQAPELVVLLSSPIEGHKIPVWEQELSCGAVAMNLLHAAAALGFGGGWVTGWAAYSPPVLEALGGRRPERVAGFLFLGTPGVELEERTGRGRGRVVSPRKGALVECGSRSDNALLHRSMITSAGRTALTAALY